MRKNLLFLTAVSILAIQLKAQININLWASKISGVAPLGVFFDASATTHTNGTIRPFHDLDFTWDFGDPTSGNWSTNGLSKNIGKGGVYAHVFEQPGTYSVSLTAKDPSGNQATQQVVITVTDPATVYAGALTRCVSPTGNFAGAPAGAAQITSNDFDAQILWLLASNGPRRLLLHRGDTLICNASTGSVSNKTGPFTIGAYGSSSLKPVVNSASNSPIDLDTTILDVRVMDIEFNGINNATAQHGITPGREMLVLRCSIKNHSNGISTSSLFGNKHRNFFIDNVFTNTLSYNIYYNFGMHVAVMGNILNTVVDEHLVRSYCTHSLFAHNQFIGGEGVPCVGVCGTQFKFVGYHPTGNPNRDPDTPTEAVEYTIVSDNIFEQPANVYSVVLGPVDGAKDQRIENCIFERNTSRGGSLTRRLLTLQGGIRITVRNNTFDFADSPQITGGVYIEQLGIEPAPVGHHVYNNTFYKGDVERVVAVYIENVSNDMVVRNNLATAPLSTDAILISGTGTNLIASNNIGYFPADPSACVTATGGSTCVDPMLVNATASNFHLQSGSPAIDAGISLNSVLEDFDRNTRPQDGNNSSTAEWDIGAFEVSGVTSAEAQSNNGNSELIIMPNPNNGVFELIFFATTNDNFTIDIINTLGQIIYNETLNNFSGRYYKKFDIDRFSKGTYVMIVKKNNLQVVKKIVTY